MDIEWASVVPTLIGAVVGASATLLGSVWVQRREVVRSARIRMFYELLPEMWARLGSQRIEGARLLDEDAGVEIDALWRCAVIAGKREEQLVAQLRRRVDQLMRPRTEDEVAEMSLDGMYLGAPVRPDEEAAIDEARRALEHHLARKIR